MPPAVSVLIASYNSRLCIQRAINSVQAQTYGNWEIIVVSDASNDGTDDVVNGLAEQDHRIRLIRHDINRGPGAARNTALDAAEGEWIAVLDADDAWRPERLEKMLAFAEETGVDFVADNQILFDAGAQREIRVALDIADESMELTLEKLLASEYQGSPLGLGLLKPIIRRRSITGLGLRYNPRLRHAEDLHFYARLLVNGIRAKVLAQPYYVYTAPIGPLSRQRSQFSHTPHSAESRLWISDDLIDAYRGQLTSGEIGEIAAYRRRAQERVALRRITSLRIDRKFLRLALFAMSHPVSSFRYVVRSRSFKHLTGRSA